MQAVGSRIETCVGSTGGGWTGTADDEIDAFSRWIEFHRVEFGCAETQEIDGFLHGGVLEVNPWDDDSAKFFSDVSNPGAFLCLAEASVFEFRSVGRHGKLPSGIHLSEKFGTGVVVGGAVVVGFCHRHLLEAAACC